jgi:hypothetical protein
MPWASGSFPGNDKILPKKALFLKRPQNFIGEIFTFTQDFQNFENEVAPFSGKPHILVLCDEGAIEYFTQTGWSIFPPSTQSAYPQPDC